MKRFKDFIKEEKENESEFMEITTPIGSDDFKLFKDMINKGIDSHLEGFVKSNFFKNGHRYVFNFHKSEVDILLRRLQEAADATEDEGKIQTWIDDIKNYTKKGI
jgi:hypothetical protein